MSSDARFSNKSDPRSHSTYPPGMSRRSSQHQPPQSSVSSPGSRVQPPLPAQSIVPPYFVPSPAGGDSDQAQTQQEPSSVPDNQRISGALSRSSTGSSSLFTGSSPPVQPYPSPSLYPSRASFGGPFAVPPQPPAPFPNPSHHSYPYPYHPHPALPPDSGQYQQGTGYVPLVQQHLQPYYRHHSAPDGAVYPSISPQSVAGAPGPSHPPTYPPQQYQPLHYGSPSGPFAYPQHFQPGPYQWYYVPGSPAAPFNEGMQAQFPPHPPINYPPNQQQQQHRHAEGEGRSVPPSERPSQAPPPVNSSGSAPPQGRKPVLSQSAPRPSPPPTSAPPVSSGTPTLQSTNTGGEKASVAPTAPTRPQTERPLVRRSYHPNPPANRSDWVMWVGNVPGDTTHDELWRFLNRVESPEPGKEGAKVKSNGVTSIFLISRSNCAFVNFHTEDHLQNAIGRFNGLQLRPNHRRCPRLVCRARRRQDDLLAGVGGQRGIGLHTEHVRKQRRQEREKAEEPPSSAEDGSHCESTKASFRSCAPPALPLSSDEEVAKASSSMVKPQSVSSYASTTSSFLTRYFPKRFFILKSLTQVSRCRPPWTRCLSGSWIV